MYTAEQKLQKQRFAIIRDNRFRPMAAVLMIGSSAITDKPIVAATNGRDEIYGREFVDSVTPEELRFVILHEAYHKMLRHLRVWKEIPKEDKALGNQAMDYVINGMLDNVAGPKVDGFAVMPKGKYEGLLDHAYDGMDSMEVFRKLKRKQQQQQQQQSGGTGVGGNDGGNFDEHDFDGSEDLPQLSDDESSELARTVETAVRQGAIHAGKSGTGGSRVFDGLLEVVTPWQDILQDFLTTNSSGTDLSTWRRPSRRGMARDIMQPSTYSESMERIVFAFDTSGSISNDDLRVMLSECAAAMRNSNPKTVDIIYWDTAVCAHETYEDEGVDNIVHSTKPKGGGGTRVGAVNSYLKRNSIRPDCIVIFTDGYVESDWGGVWDAPVLWGVTTRTVAPTGQTVYIQL